MERAGKRPNRRPELQLAPTAAESNVSDDMGTLNDVVDAKQEFLDDQNNCCLCGSELSFKHVTDHLELTVVEDARCSSCHIPLRKRHYRLH